MSQHNTRQEKKLRSLARALRKDRLPKYLNLIHWLEDHGEAQTAGAARKLILDKRVKYESHPLGISIIEREVEGQDEPEKIEVLNPFIPASLRDGIEVVAA